MPQQFQIFLQQTFTEKTENETKNILTEMTAVNHSILKKPVINVILEQAHEDIL